MSKVINLLRREFPASVAASPTAVGIAASAKVTSFANPRSGTVSARTSPDDATG